MNQVNPPTQQEEVPSVAVFIVSSVIGLILVWNALALFGMVPGSRTEEEPKELTSEELAEEREEDLITDLRRDFEPKIRNLLNNPSSYEYVSTNLTEEDGMHLITIRFRATNAFGGVITQYAIGQYSPSSKEVIEVLYIGSR